MNPDINYDLMERMEDLKKASIHYNWFSMLIYLGEAWFYSVDKYIQDKKGFS